MTARHATIDTNTDIGTVILVADGDHLTGLYFPGHRPRPNRTDLGPEVDPTHCPLLRETARQVVDYVCGRRTGFALPIATHGTPFTEQVWAMLRDIPHGQTTTYGHMADRLGNRALARRVGQAVARNPLSIIVPCHRVIGHDGRLTGYAGGLDRKRFLLELEARVEMHAP